MGLGADEIDFAVGESAISLVGRRQQLEGNVDALVGEKSELDRSHRRKVRVGDHVWQGELHGRIALLASSVALAAVSATGSVDRTWLSTCAHSASVSLKSRTAGEPA